MSRKRFQIVVVGSGFGGSLTAMIAQRLGFSTALIERGRHPRFAIGESSTPLANLLLEEIATDYDLPLVRPLCKWGTWQKQLPHIGCGIKRGFTFYHHEFGRRFGLDMKAEKQLLVRASPNEEVSDTHWYRPDFDQYLAEHAQKLGVEYWDETILDCAVMETGGISLSGKRHGQYLEFAADFVVDATGPRGFLHRALEQRETAFHSMPRTHGLFSHFRDVGSLPLDFSLEGQDPPYPPEQAAVHHVFPGGWVWVLKFNNGITSAGVAATDDVARWVDFDSGESGWRQLLERLPSLAEIFGSAQAIIPFVHSRRLAFRSELASGDHWALLPSAAGFIDPLLSTGFPLTLLGVQRIGVLLREHWQRASFCSQLNSYSDLTLLELDTAAQLVGALYASMDHFDVFRELSLLYFASVIFSETARRQRKFHLADSFLLCQHPTFANQFQRACAMATQAFSNDQTRELQRQIRKAIESFDVAELSDSAPWYPALVEDLLHSAATRPDRPNLSQEGTE